jgi:hypothetical protein
MNRSAIEQQVYYWVMNRVERQIRSQTSKSADDRVWITVWWANRRDTQLGAWGRICGQATEDTNGSKSSDQQSSL